MKTWVPALLALAANAPANAAVDARVLQAPDGSRTLVHEVIVAAPSAEVWKAISTAEGWKNWAVPVAWAPQPDEIETSYSKDARPGDPTTITQKIIARIPQRMMLFQTTKAPQGFPDFDSYRKVMNLFELEPVGEDRTRVRLTASGYEPTEAGGRLLSFFEKGNSDTLAQLQAKLGRANGVTADSKFASMAFLVGHCWRGEFVSRHEMDTHCFEAVFDGKHIRDRHEVTGGKSVYRGETIYSWNPELGRVEYTYWNSLGGVSRGTMVPKDAGLDFGDETHTLADGRKLVISTLWRKVGADAYEAVSRSNDVTGEKVVTYRKAD